MATSSRKTGFSAEERAAMRERAEELKASQADGETIVLAKLAAMPEPDRTLGERLHALIKTIAPELTPRTWYGMPAYGKGDRVICFFQNAGKFKARYSTLGFSDKAKLDEGAIWPTSFALTEWSAAVEAKVTALLKKATRH
ncbi:MAG: iron chaperone [Terriglobales bacterium]